MRKLGEDKPINKIFCAFVTAVKINSSHNSFKRVCQNILPRFAVFVFGFVLTSARFFLFALYPPLGIAILFVVIASMGAGPLNPIIGAVEFERTPRNMRGRVGGAIGAGAWSAMPLGMLIGGVLTEQLGVRTMLLGLGVTYLVTTLSMAVIPAMKEMNRRKEVAPEGVQ